MGALFRKAEVAVVERMQTYASKRSTVLFRHLFRHTTLRHQFDLALLFLLFRHVVKVGEL